MIWLTWRQFRAQAVLLVGAVVAIAVVALVTGPHLVHLYDTTVATCATHGNCPSAVDVFLKNDSALRNLLGWLVIAVPSVIGIFWGAPLVAREVEAGTHRLAWTQSVSRTRWLVTKLGMIGLASMAVVGLMSLTVTWWASPLDQANAALFGTFDQRDIVPIGYAAFAFTLGVTAGVLIRRTVPAMATTFVVFVAARLAFGRLIRPHLMAPTLHTLALDPNSIGFGSTNGGPFVLEPNPSPIPNAWIYSTQIVDKAGNAITPQYVARACPQLAQSVSAGGPPAGPGHAIKAQVPAAVQQALQTCVTKVGATYHELVTYQPSSHYWMIQWYETACYLGGALVLAGISLWWVRRRLA